MRKVRIRTWFGLALGILALILAPIDWRLTLIVGGVGMVISVLNLITAE